VHPLRAQQQIQTLRTQKRIQSQPRQLLRHIIPTVSKKHLRRHPSALADLLKGEQLTSNGQSQYRRAARATYPANIFADEKRVATPQALQRQIRTLLSTPRPESSLVAAQLAGVVGLEEGGVGSHTRGPSEL
jgi:hypothetical protein